MCCPETYPCIFFVELKLFVILWVCRKFAEADMMKGNEYSQNTTNVKKMSFVFFLNFVFNHEIEKKTIWFFFLPEWIWHFSPFQTVCPLPENRLHLCLLSMTTGICPVWSPLISAPGIEPLFFLLSLSLSVINGLPLFTPATAFLCFWR